MKTLAVPATTDAAPDGTSDWPGEGCFEPDTGVLCLFDKDDEVDGK